MILDFYHDAGHGWLKVPKSLIPPDLKISQYSYKNDDFVFLEEDCDAVSFIKQFGDTFEIVHKYDGKISHIRDLERYI